MPIWFYQNVPQCAPLPTGAEIRLIHTALRNALGDAPLLMAASVTFTLPAVILFFVAQRYFVKGIVMSGLKG